jgi:transcriptional regulator of acetoin/glycerol metabolism
MPAPPDESLDDVKRRRLIDALKRSNGNQSETARRLGISRTSVWNQIRRYNLQRELKQLK